MKKSWAAGVCQSVCVSVCVCVSKHFRAQRPNGWSDRDAGEAPIDAPKRRNDNGAGLGLVGGTWHVARAAA